MASSYSQALKRFQANVDMEEINRKGFNTAVSDYFNFTERIQEEKKEIKTLEKEQDTIKLAETRSRINRYENAKEKMVTAFKQILEPPMA
ncbi:unnamed protein product, partial [marine sediment metagenome]